MSETAFESFRADNSNFVSLLNDFGDELVTLSAAPGERADNEWDDDSCGVEDSDE